MLAIGEQSRFLACCVDHALTRLVCRWKKFGNARPAHLSKNTPLDLPHLLTQVIVIIAIPNRVEAKARAVNEKAVRCTNKTRPSLLNLSVTKQSLPVFDSAHALPIRNCRVLYPALLCLCPLELRRMTLLRCLTKWLPSHLRANTNSQIFFQLENMATKGRHFQLLK